MKKRLISMMLVLSMLTSLAACAKPIGTPGDTIADTIAETTAEAVTTEEETTGAATDGTRIFTDSVGREVEIPAEISRIVPSGPLAQIILFAIAPDMFVGLSQKWYDSARGIIADEYFDLPYFGDLYASADLNLEELAMADPDLLIDIGMPKPTAAEDLDMIQEQTTIPAIYVSASMETMPETYRQLGELLGREEKGEELAQFCERVYNRTLSIMEKVGDNKVNGLFVLGEEGLNVLAKGSYHAEVIDLLFNNLAVVENPLSKGTGNEVSMEQIAIWNPDFILFAPRSIYSTVSEMDAWSEIPAVVNHNYVEVPDAPHNWMTQPPAVQRYLGLIWLTAVLYPDYCDYDVKADVMEYYQLFYHCDLTDAQYEALTENAFLK